METLTLKALQTRESKVNDFLLVQKLDEFKSKWSEKANEWLLTLSGTNRYKNLEDLLSLLFGINYNSFYDWFTSYDFFTTQPIRTGFGINEVNFWSNLLKTKFGLNRFLSFYDSFGIKTRMHGKSLSKENIEKVANFMSIFLILVAEFISDNMEYFEYVPNDLKAYMFKYYTTKEQIFLSTLNKGFRQAFNIVHPQFKRYEQTKYILMNRLQCVLRNVTQIEILKMKPNIDVSTIIIVLTTLDFDSIKKQTVAMKQTGKLFENFNHPYFTITRKLQNPNEEEKQTNKGEVTIMYTWKRLPTRGSEQYFADLIVHAIETHPQITEMYNITHTAHANLNKTIKLTSKTRDHYVALATLMRIFKIISNFNFTRSPKINFYLLMQSEVVTYSMFPEYMCTPEDEPESEAEYKFKYNLFTILKPLNIYKADIHQEVSKYNLLNWEYVINALEYIREEEKRVKEELEKKDRELNNYQTKWITRKRFKQ